MNSEILTFSYPDGEIQRAQVVRLDKWEELEFLRPNPAAGAFDGFCRIYEEHLGPTAPYAFGNLIMFRLPEGMEVPFPLKTGSFALPSKSTGTPSRNPSFTPFFPHSSQSSGILSTTVWTAF